MIDTVCVGLLIVTLGRAYCRPRMITDMRPFSDSAEPEPRVLTLAAAAQRAGVTRSTIARAYRAGRLRYFRTPGGGVVRIPSNALQDWIAANSYGGPPQ